MPAPNEKAASGGFFHHPMRIGYAIMFGLIFCLGKFRFSTSLPYYKPT
jgi:hypothetical protein